MHKMATDICSTHRSLPEDLPPSYESVVASPKLDPLNTFPGLTEEELDWVRDLRNGDKRLCICCKDPSLRKLERLCLGIRKCLMPSAWIDLDGAVSINRAKFCAALTSLRCRDIRAAEAILEWSVKNRVSADLAHCTTFAFNRKGRMLLKLEGYRGLGAMKYLDIKQISAFLPACIHCRGSRILAEQFKHASDNWLHHGLRSAGTVLRCFACPTEYVTMIVPRAPCHLKRSRVGRVPEAYFLDFGSLRGRPNWSKYMMIKYTRWIDLGPFDSSLQTIEERLDTAKKVTFDPSQSLLSARYDDIAEPICALFEGRNVWSYSSSAPHRLLISREVASLDDAVPYDKPQAESF